ncbi:hypothetical protein ABZY09_14565 [Streptomyces sp. NPDC002928]|uniref:hypothetical protein n=1 Tax=Streptomyces sp. NPDC002928 TaxID=3154440 RepID=UPI0033BF509E
MITDEMGRLEHLGDVHGVAGPRVGQRLAELRALKRVETTGGVGLFLERDRVLDPGLGDDKVLPVGRLLVGRHSLVDQISYAVPRFCGPIRPWLSANPVISRHRF